MNDDRISAFCHIIKAAGTTVTRLLRQNFGLRHIDVHPGRARVPYSLAHLERDLRWNPAVRSLAGHSLRPHVEFPGYDDRMVWYTWLRKPVARLISGYQHSLEKGGRSISFENWLREPGHRNVMTLFLSGSETDLEGAKQVIDEKMAFVGLVEDFDRSLVMLRDRVFAGTLNIHYSRPANTARKGIAAEEARAQAEKLGDLIEANTSVDQALYSWFVDERFPRYLADYGEGEIETRIAELQDPEQRLRYGSVHEFATNGFRRFIYRPIISRF